LALADWICSRLVIFKLDVSDGLGTGTENISFSAALRSLSSRRILRYDEKFHRRFFSTPSYWYIKFHHYSEVQIALRPKKQKLLVECNSMRMSRRRKNIFVLTMKQRKLLDY